MPGPVRYDKKGRVKKTKPRSFGSASKSQPKSQAPVTAAASAVAKATKRAVSRADVPKAARKARKSALASKEAQESIERLRQKFSTNLDINQRTAKRERKLENTALKSLYDTRGEALKAEKSVRAATRLNAEGSRVESLDGLKQVGVQPLGQVQRAADAGQIRREGKTFTTPQVRRTRRQVKRAKRELRRAKAATMTPKKNLMKAGLDAEQAQVLSTVLRVGKKRGATKKEMLAAVETAIQESGIRNLGYGDADSSGWRQERAMYYPTGKMGPQNVKASANRFFDESISDANRGAGMTAGQLAQAIQASAYPDRYDERKGEAVPLLKAFNSAGNASPEAKARLRRAEDQAAATARRANKLGLSYEGIVTPKQAKNLGLKPLDQSNAPPKAVKSFKGMIAAAQQLEGWQLPYVWGGGHGTTRVGDPRQYGGLDCSSTVSHILQSGGVNIPTIVSGSFGEYTKPGPGAVTILYNPGHVLMKIGTKYFGTSGTNPSGGPGWIDKSVGDSEMASGKYSIGHIPGLGPKIAKQMNLDPESYRVFPGMKVENNTATAITGTVSYSPTFSNTPILEGRQQPNRGRKNNDVLKLLRQLGYSVTRSGVKRVGGELSTFSQAPESITDLKKRYKVE